MSGMGLSSQRFLLTTEALLEYKKNFPMNESTHIIHTQEHYAELDSNTLSHMKRTGVNPESANLYRNSAIVHLWYNAVMVQSSQSKGK